MGTIRRILVWLMVVLPLPVSTMAEPLPRSILLLDQSDPNTPWGIAIRAAFRSAINSQSTTPLALYVEILDLGRFNGPGYIDVLREYLREKYRDKPIGVVVTHGAAMFEIALRLRSELWPKVPIVFAVVDQKTASRLVIPPDVTGTFLRLSLSDAILAARALVPDLKRIVHVGDPLERQPYYSHFAEDFVALSKQIEVVDLAGLPMSDLRRRVAELPSDAAIIYTAIYVDGAGATYMTRDALAAVAEVANRPIVSFSELHIGYGTAGGFVAKPVTVAEHAAASALRILSGESASQIPITVDDFTRPVFDWLQLKRFDVDENRLPPGSEIRFRPLTMWQQYHWHVLAAVAIVLAQTLMIAGLFVERRRRHSAEADARRHLLEVMHLNRIAAAGEMSASIAHEVNQPLAAIVSSANAGLRWLSKRTPDLEEVAAGLKRIVSDGHRASRVVKTVREMFQKDTQERTLVDISELIREVLALSRIELKEHQISVSSVLTEGLPRVLIDRTQLQQVMMNLIGNAVEAMCSVTDRARVLRIRSEANGSGEVIVTIEDSGPGIDPTNLDRIFEAFFTTKSKGMGMGLSICRSIIRAHDGQLSAAAGKSHGAIFEIVLPGDEGARE